MKNIPRRFIICCLLAFLCCLWAAEEPRYNIVSREVTAGMGEATSTSHVRQIVSREVTVGMGEAISTNHVRQIVSREVTVGVGSVTSTNHVRNYFSREYTAGVGEETMKILPESAYLTGTVELSLDAQFVQNPLQMMFNWSLRHDGATLTSGSANEWESFRYVWDTTSGEDGAYDVEMRFTRPNQDDVVLSQRYYVLNTTCTAHFKEEIDGDVVWKNDGKVHLVIGKLIIKNGGSLVIEPWVIVKFVDGASLVVEKGGSLDLSGVVLTHFADDAHGGDTNGDGAQSMPQYNKYSFSVDAQAEVITDADTEFCYMTITSSGKLTTDTLWPGNCLINVTNDLTVASGATLTILPGAIIKVAAGKSITVQSGGALNAIGNRAQPIVFTSVKDDEHGGDTNGDGTATSAQAGDWYYVYANGGTASLAYCTLMYGAPSNERGIVQVGNSGRLTMDCCTIAHALYDGVWNWGGSLIMNHCVVTDCGNAVAPYRGTNVLNCCVFYDNNYGLMYWSGWSGRPVFTNCIFKNMTAGWIEDNKWRNAYDNVSFSHCLFHSDGDTDISEPPIIGSNGNIWADPKFMDAKSWNFQLRPDSPSIDAGDGTVSNLPQYDYYGNPRCWSDGRVTPTGIAAANGNYPDIGLFEMCGEMDSDLDVVMNWVEGPTTAMAGDTVTIRWQAANIGTVAGSGVRRDNIYLVSKDERLGNRRVFIATATVSGRLAPGGVVTYTFDKAQIPPVTPGKWGFAVFANEERDWFEGRNIENNYRVSSGDCEIMLPMVACTTQSTTLSVNASETVGFQLTDVPVEGAMLVVRNGKDINMTGLFGQLPEAFSLGWKAVHLGNGTVLLTIPPATVDNNVFIMLENSGEKDTQVEFSALLGAFVLFDNGVMKAATNSGTVTIPLYGVGLTADMDVYLARGADRIDAKSLIAVQNDTFYATFDVKGAALGNWTLCASNENGSGSFEALFLFMNWHQEDSKWWCRLELPSAIRRGRTVVGTFIYGNSGNVDMDAPYVKIEGETGVNIRLSENDAWGKSIEFMALSDTFPVSRLKAGEERRQTFEFIQLNDNSKVDIKYEYIAKKLFTTLYNYFEGYYTIPTPFPWSMNNKDMRPDWASDEDWNVILNRLKSAIGLTWNSFFDRMRSNADYLAMLGRGTNDLGSFWQMDVRDAFATDNAVSTLGSSTDLVRNGRGFNIVVSRRFGTSMKTRSYIGMFGKGWVMSYETKVILKNDKTLSFELPSGGSYTFSKTKDIWEPMVVGDKTQLKETDKVYILNYRDGSIAEFSKESGAMLSIRDCNGNGLDFQYSGNQLCQIVHTDGQWVKFSYSGSYVTKAEDDLGHIVRYIYNGNRLVSFTSSDDLTTEYGYDIDANALKTIAYPNGTTRDYNFDDMGRVSSISRNGNQQTVVIERGRFGSYAVINAAGALYETVVGASGEVLYTVDALGNKVIRKYDNDVLAVSSIQTAMGHTVNYEYDKDFNIVRSIAPDGTATQFAYSIDFGELERYIDAKGQAVAYSYDNKGQGISNMLMDGKGDSLEYNDKGEVISTSDRSGKQNTIEYDVEGRVISVKDSDDRITKFVYDSQGNLVKLKDSLLGDTTMTYTAQEWLKSITYADGRGFSYAYDDFGRMVKQTFSDGFVQQYEYDDLGRVSRMTDKNGKLLVSLEYDAVTGLPLSRTFGNDTSVHYAYDLNGNVLSITHKDKNGSVLELFQYTYDADGRCTQVESSEGVEAYTYDLAGQLMAVAYPDGKTESFQYDAVGNRVSANGEAYTVNELNQYLTVGDATFTYDDNGNMASRTDANGTTTYEYDANSRLVRVIRPDGTEWSCQYDFLDNRTMVNDDGQIRKQMHTFGSLPSLAAEYNASGKLIRRYILLGSMLIADVDSTGNYRYYHADGLGSTRLLTNDAGAVVSRKSYNVFGGLRTATGEAMRFGFVGTYGVEADATGLVFMRNRYYDTAIGRFTQMDPIGISAGDVNWYRYCGNNPVMYVDIDGEDSSDCSSVGKKSVDIGIGLASDVINDIDDNVNLYQKIFSGYFKNGFVPHNFGDPASGRTHFILDQLKRYERYQKIAKPFKIIKRVYDKYSKVKDYANSVRDEGFWVGTARWGFEHSAGLLINFLSGGKASGLAASADAVMGTIGEWILPKPTCGDGSPSDGSGWGSTFSHNSHDPNEMVGPLGFGNETTERFVTPGEWLSYTINFENKSSATAAAQEVFVDAQLSEYLDWSTFEIGSVLFSNQTEIGLMGRQRGKILVDRQNTNQKVQIDVTMNASTGKVRWYLRSYDPNTTDHWPASVYDGFLPPNDDNHAGEGSLTYRIKVKDDAPHNARIDASAEIIFDTNAMIPTDPAWFNTVYAMAPQDDFDPSLPDGTAMLQLDSLSWKAVAGASEYDVTLWKVVNGKDELVGSATGLKMGYWDISNYAESDSPGTTYHWQIVARNNLGSKTSNVYYFRTLGADEQAGYALRPGWNLIAVPFEIEAENGGSELLSMSPIVYERLYNVYARATESMKSGTAAWLFSRETKSIRIWTDKGLQGEPKLPPELSNGWNLTGICGTQELLLDCEAEGVSAIWTWNGRKFTAVPIENGAALLEPGVGYWLYLDK